MSCSTEDNRLLARITQKEPSQARRASVRRSSIVLQLAARARVVGLATYSKRAAAAASAYTTERYPPASRRSRTAVAAGVRRMHSA